MQQWCNSRGHNIIEENGINLLGNLDVICKFNKSCSWLMYLKEKKKTKYWLQDDNDLNYN